MLLRSSQVEALKNTYAKSSSTKSHKPQQRGANINVPAKDAKRNPQEKDESGGCPTREGRSAVASLTAAGFLLQQ